MSNRIGAAATLAIIGAGTLGIHLAPLTSPGPAWNDVTVHSTLARTTTCDDEPDCDDDTTAEDAGHHGRGGGHHEHRKT